MLNYVWISLLLIGIFTAVGRDINDEVTNTYRNGVPITAQFELSKQRTSVRPAYDGEIILSAAAFNQFYNTSTTQSQQSDIRQTAILTTLNSGKQKLEIPISDATPVFWKEMAEAAGGKDKLEAEIVSFYQGRKEIVFTMERVSYVKIKAVTKAAIEYSNTAVTISLGLIGVMALWLGIMKVGEAA